MYRSTMKRLTNGVILGVLLAGTSILTIAAQGACEEGTIPALYEAPGADRTFCFLPSEGVYQEVVVEVQTTTFETLGTEAIPDLVRVKLAGFLLDGIAYEQVKTHVEDQRGIYEDAELGDSYGLTELK
jgi:hypothetical protein